MVRKLAQLIIYLFACVVLLSPLLADAHSGRTDRYGGHHDRKHGGYHYHNGGYAYSKSYKSAKRHRVAHRATHHRKK